MENKITTIQVTKDVIDALKSVKRYPRESYAEEIKYLLSEYEKTRLLPTIDEIRTKAMPILKKFGVEKAALFGSYARGEENRDSDIDILVELPKGTSLLTFSALKLELEASFGRRFDIISYGWIDEHIRNRIMRERIVLYE